MKKGLFIIATILFISSCCKDDPIIIIPKIHHMPMEIGNYWVYQHYNIDSSGVETPLSIYDSIVITKDTIIRDNKYFIFEKTQKSYTGTIGTIRILRDSLGYLIDDKGKILLADKNFKDTLAYSENINTYTDSTGAIISDTLYTLYYKMYKYSNIINVPAGSFDDILNYRGHLNVFNSPIGKHQVFMNNYYSKDIGAITKTYVYLSSAYKEKFEKRLTRYNIN